MIWVHVLHLSLSCVSCHLLWLYSLIKQHSSFSWRTQLWPQRAATVQLQQLLKKQCCLHTIAFSCFKCHSGIIIFTHYGIISLLMQLPMSILSLQITYCPAEKDNICGLMGLCASFPIQLSHFIRCNWTSKHRYKLLYVTSYISFHRLSNVFVNLHHLVGCRSPLINWTKLNGTMGFSLYQMVTFINFTATGTKIWCHALFQSCLNSK